MENFILYEVSYIRRNFKEERKILLETELNKLSQT